MMSGLSIIMGSHRAHKSYKEKWPLSLILGILAFQSQLAEALTVVFTQNLTEPLSIGSHISLTGTPSDDVILSWFTVNIGCGDCEKFSDDIAVHFSVRVPDSEVVRNTMYQGKWGIEESASLRPFPFKLNQQFKIEVLVDEKETIWAVDGKYYCSYAHRYPSPLNATWVRVTGIKDAILKVQNARIQPTMTPEPIDVTTSANPELIFNHSLEWWLRSIGARESPPAPGAQRDAWRLGGAWGVPATRALV